MNASAIASDISTGLLESSLMALPNRGGVKTVMILPTTRLTTETTTRILRSRRSLGHK